MGPRFPLLRFERLSLSASSVKRQPRGEEVGQASALSPPNVGRITLFLRQRESVKVQSDAWPETDSVDCKVAGNKRGRKNKQKKAEPGSLTVLFPLPPFFPPSLPAFTAARL